MNRLNGTIILLQLLLQLMLLLLPWSRQLIANLLQRLFYLRLRLVVVAAVAVIATTLTCTKLRSHLSFAVVADVIAAVIPASCALIF